MLRRLLVSCFFLSCACFAGAQVGIYGTVTVLRLGGINTTPCLIATSSTTNSLACVAPSPVPQTPALVLSQSVTPLGGTFGVFYDFRNVGPVRLGIDARVVDNHGTRGSQVPSDGSGTRVQSYLGGVRASFHTPILALKPYVQASAGFGRSDYGFLRNEDQKSADFEKVLLTNNFEYHVFAGTDLRLGSFVDFRVVELGYGGLNPFGTYAHNYSLGSISTGVVFHLPSLP